MTRTPTFRDRVEARRPPGAPKRETNALFQTALRFRNQLARRVAEIESESFLLDADELDDLALALTELAEDLHDDAGLWRSLEAYHREFFGVPLPLLCQPGESGLEPFDPRRFQFFLSSVWRHFQPDHIVGPTHHGFVTIAEFAAEFLGEAFSARPARPAAVASFLARPNRRGWDVKRKLVWLGTRSFLFRFAFEDHLRKANPEPDQEIAETDDFLCQQCTEWSGLGPVDILAAALDLPSSDRTELRGWHERHTAFYRIESLNVRGTKVETLDAVNLINDQPYRVRMEIDRQTCPFLAGQMAYGSLVPWRGEWVWSGGQQRWESVPKDFASTRKAFRETYSSIAYRYCPDLTHQAREIAAEHYADFVQFHGNDLAVFPDGLSAAAAEQKRMGAFSERKARKNLQKVLAKHGLTSPAPGSYPQAFLENENGIAVFYHEGQGTEMFTGFDTLISGLKKKDKPLTQPEMETLQAFIEGELISPAFVRRVIRDAGSTGLETLYFLTGSPNGIDYLLRRFKGRFYRNRYPAIFLRE